MANISRESLLRRKAANREFVKKGPAETLSAREGSLRRRLAHHWRWRWWRRLHLRRRKRARRGAVVPRSQTREEIGFIVQGHARSACLLNSAQFISLFLLRPMNRSTRRGPMKFW